MHSHVCTHKWTHSRTQAHTCMHSHMRVCNSFTHVHATQVWHNLPVSLHTHSYMCTLTARHMLSHTHNRLVTCQRTHSAAQMHVSPQMCLQLSWCTDHSAHRKGGWPAPDLGPQISAGHGLCGVGKEPKTEPAAPDSVQEPWACLHLFPSRRQRHFCKLSLLGS